jgi:hypothetical protein
MPRHSLKLRSPQAIHLALLLFALVNSGCLLATAGVAGGAIAGYAYCKGKVCETYAASFADTWTAAHTALAELGMPILKEERKVSEASIESRTADGERVRIYLQSETSKIPAEGQITWVCVRVATFGDHPVSHRVMDQVGVHLAPAPLPGSPAPTATLGVIHTGSSAPAAGFPQQTAPPPLLPPEPLPAQQQTTK